MAHHELMETAALGVDPSIFLILPKETKQPTIIHHILKVPKNALVANETEEFFCLFQIKRMISNGSEFPIKDNNNEETQTEDFDKALS
jgi:hypothetical protein